MVISLSSCWEAARKGDSRQILKSPSNRGERINDRKGSERAMATRKFSDTVKADLQGSPEFRGTLLSEAVACMVAGDLETGKIVLREYVNGTVGFPGLGAALGRSPKSLMRMLGPQGNPQARNLFEMVAYLQKTEGYVLHISPAPAAA
jgi:hypothetical protein